MWVGVHIVTHITGNMFLNPKNVSHRRVDYTEQRGIEVCHFGSQLTFRIFVL